MIYEFAIKKETLNNGKEIFTPVMRERKNKWLLFRLPENNWQRIICQYGVYGLQELDWVPELSFEECEKHVEGYKQVLISNKSNNVKESDLINHEENIEI